MRARWRRTTVRAPGGVDATTHAPLRSRRTQAIAVYRVRILGAGDAPTSPSTSKDTRLLAIACTPLRLIEVPSSTAPGGRLSLGNHHAHEEATSGASTRHRTPWLVASTDTPAPWARGLFHQPGERLVHRHLPAGPAPFLQPVAPYRTARVVCGEGLGTGDLAGQPLGPRGEAVRPRAGVVSASHPRGHGPTRHARRPYNRRSAARRHAPTGRRRSGRPAGQPRPAAADAPEATARGGARAQPTDHASGPPAREWQDAR